MAVEVTIIQIVRSFFFLLERIALRNHVRTIGGLLLTEKIKMNTGMQKVTSVQSRLRYLAPLRLKIDRTIAGCATQVYLLRKLFGRKGKFSGVNALVAKKV